MHDSDWLAKAFISLIAYTFKCKKKTAVRHSDWLYRLFSHVKNIAYRFLQMSFMEENSRVTCNKECYAIRYEGKHKFKFDDDVRS